MKSYIDNMVKIFDKSDKSTYAKDYRSIRPYLDGTLQNSALLKAFAKYTSQLHMRGIVHKDYSPGNILWKYNEVSGEYSFYIVDVNKMLPEIRNTVKMEMAVQ